MHIDHQADRPGRGIRRLELIETLKGQAHGLLTNLGRVTLRHDDDHLPQERKRSQIRDGSLRTLGISPTLGRNTALMDMAAEMPAAVIARLLGISLDRATRWTYDAGNTRPGYAREVARRDQLR
ncbi:hypothetical protein GCM10010178_39600 [Lentzea flava]|uniref:Uncharacterized protein n=1 Tax=Lentzea flava TaxID=103732 RepID=A0ABQ2UL10_9PSEU|nr:hypothetical protein GCM10010178_39600 [Lentzea flava]